MVFRSNQKISPIPWRKIGCKTQKERILEAYQSILKSLWIKSTSIFKEHTRLLIKLSIEKSWCRQKNTRAYVADFHRCRYEVDGSRHNPEKNSKIIPFLVKSLLESNCILFRQSAIREKFIKEAKTQLKKKLIPIMEATIPIKTMK